MTSDEREDLHKQASELAYLAIRLADLSPLLSCDEWDTLADEIGREMVALALRRVDVVREAREAEDAAMEAWLQS